MEEAEAPEGAEATVSNNNMNCEVFRRKKQIRTAAVACGSRTDRYVLYAGLFWCADILCHIDAEA